MNPPNLAGVIAKSDVFTKGSGSYAASYISWARIANYLHEHAPGWQFHLKPTIEGNLAWAAPNGTAYVVGYFRGPDGEITADFPFPVMDHRNQSVPMDKVDGRSLSDTHRRALCAAAAFTFGLGYELWAKAEIDEAQHQAGAVAPDNANATQPTIKAKPKVKAAPQQAPAEVQQSAAVEAEAPDLLSPEAKADLVRIVSAAPPDVRSKAVAAFQQRYNLPSDQKIADFVRTNEHLEVLMEALGNAA